MLKGRKTEIKPNQIYRANFVIFWPVSMKVLWQWVPCERNSSYNFIRIFLKLCTCFPHGLEMCMWFGYNPWIYFCHFFHYVNFVIFWPQVLWKCIDSGYLVSATPYTISCLSLCNFAHLFSSPEPKAHKVSLKDGTRASVRPSFHTFKHEYLRDQQADYNQILSEASLGLGKGCIRFCCRSDQNSGFHGNG